MTAEFTAPRDALLGVIAPLMGVIDHNASLPMLRHLLIVAEGETLTLTASNLETELTANCPAQIAAPGALAIPARKLHDILKNQPSDTELRLRATDDRANLVAGRARFALTHLPADDYPRLSSEGDARARLDLEAGALKAAIGKAAFAMGKNDVRYYLNGLHLATDGALALRLTGTDGHRLARAQAALSAREGDDLDVILNHHAVLALARLLPTRPETIRLHLSRSHLTAHLPGLTLVSKLIDGKYPDADRVIPRGLPRRAILDRAALKAGVARVNVLANEQYRGVRLTFDRGTLKIEASNPEGESAEDAIELDYDGPNVAIGFNAAYLTDLLGAVDTERVAVEIADGNSSSLWRGLDQDQETFVLMPMRL